MKITPHLLYADNSGNILDDPNLLMLCASGDGWRLPESAELIPLPQESDLFLLPGRKAVGLDARSGKIVEHGGLAVAAFAAPGHTLSAHPFWHETENAPVLPYFAYGAVGYFRGNFWICAKKVDGDKRQQFQAIGCAKIEKNCVALLRKYPENRLVSHIINNCVRKYSCPAARNFALGRYEAPLPTARSCNAHCIGCISLAQAGAPHEQTPQCRIKFTPEAEEIAQVMRIHESREKARPIYSFGQGCEGDPLTNAQLLSEAIRCFRTGGGHGTVNCNTNGSLPDAVEELAASGLTSMRVSLNSAIPEHYELYYRPAGYSFDSVLASIKIARRHDIFISLNLLYFPGITDTQAELEALADLVTNSGVCMIQWRNLNIDPCWFRNYMPKPETETMGLERFMKNLKARCPWLRYGYFNPWLGDRAEISAPQAR